MRQHLICETLKAKIDSSGIWGRCPFPTTKSPHGFEFSFPSLSVQKISECEIPQDVGLILCSPCSMSKIVLIRSDELGEDHYDFEEVNRLFKISHWKLIDLLQMQKKSEIEEALQRMLIGRQYSCVRFEAIDGKYRESVKSVVNW